MCVCVCAPGAVTPGRATPTSTAWGPLFPRLLPGCGLYWNLVSISPGRIIGTGWRSFRSSCRDVVPPTEREVTRTCVHPAVPSLLGARATSTSMTWADGVRDVCLDAHYSGPLLLQAIVIPSVLPDSRLCRLVCDRVPLEQRGLPESSVLLGTRVSTLAPTTSGTLLVLHGSTFDVLHRGGYELSCCHDGPQTSPPSYSPSILSRGAQRWLRFVVSWRISAGLFPKTSY